MDFSEARSNYAVASDFRSSPGGKGLNTAIGCVAFDAKRSDLLARVGADMYGELAMNYAHANGLKKRSLIIDSDAQTGMGLVRVNPSGDYETVVIKGANENLSPLDYSRYISEHRRPNYVVASLETPMPAIRSVAKSTPQVRLVVNISPWSADSKEALSLSDIAVLNLSEARELIDEDGSASKEDLLAGLKKSCNGTIVITLGDEGAIAIDEKGEIWHVVGEPAVPVNTVGAGDSFLAGLVMSISAGLPLEQAIRVANQAGMIACLSADSHLTSRDVLKIHELSGFSPEKEGKENND